MWLWPVLLLLVPPISVGEALKTDGHRKEANKTGGVSADTPTSDTAVRHDGVANDPARLESRQEALLAYQTLIEKSSKASSAASKKAVPTESLADQRSDAKHIDKLDPMPDEDEIRENVAQALLDDLAELAHDIRRLRKKLRDDRQEPEVDTDMPWWFSAVEMISYSYSIIITLLLVRSWIVPRITTRGRSASTDNSTNITDSGVSQAEDSLLSGGKAARRTTARDTATAIDNQRRNFALHAQNDTMNTRLPVSDLRRHVTQGLLPTTPMRRRHLDPARLHFHTATPTSDFTLRIGADQPKTTSTPLAHHATLI